MLVYARRSWISRGNATSEGTLYGEPHIISNAFMQRLRDVPSIKSGDAKALRDLYLLANKCLSAMSSLNVLSVMDFPANLQHIAMKLPLYLHNKWRDRISRSKSRVCFSDLVDFLLHASSSANIQR